jgi:DNA-binding Lrp family transcriptional regulator
MKDVRVLDLGSSKELGKVLQGKQTKQILSYLEEHEKATASELAKELNVGLSTIHYQVKALVQAGILEDGEFSYSKKGREIIHYSLTNDIIVVVPKKAEKTRIMQVLGMVLPASLGVMAVGLISGLLQRIQTNPVATDEAAVAEIAAAPMQASARSADIMLAQETTQQIVTTQANTFPQLWLGIIIGAAATALITLIILGIYKYCYPRKKDSTKTVPIKKKSQTKGSKRTV